METLGRLLNMGKNSAAMNMAIDEAILAAQKVQPNPTLRFYGWSFPAFSFGYFQDIAAEVDVEACRADGIELVKRMTGGGTVVHGWELTYTLILPRGAAEIGVSEVYRCIGQSLVRAFQKLGVPAECYAINTDSPGGVGNRPYRMGVSGGVGNRPYRMGVSGGVGNRPYRAEANSPGGVGNRPYRMGVSGGVGNRPYRMGVSGVIGNRPYRAEANSPGGVGNRPYRMGVSGCGWKPPLPGGG